MIHEPRIALLIDADNNDEFQFQPHHPAKTEQAKLKPEMLDCWTWPRIFDRPPISHIKLY
jgi:hypothetical protein